SHQPLAFEAVHHRVQHSISPLQPSSREVAHSLNDRISVGLSFRKNGEDQRLSGCGNQVFGGHAINSCERGIAALYIALQCMSRKPRDCYPWASCDACNRNCPHAASMSAPLRLRTLDGMPNCLRIDRNSCVRGAVGSTNGNSVTPFMGIRFTWATRGCTRWANCRACSGRSFTLERSTYS